MSSKVLGNRLMEPLTTTAVVRDDDDHAAADGKNNIGIGTKKAANKNQQMI